MRKKCCYVVVATSSEGLSSSIILLSPSPREYRPTVRISFHRISLQVRFIQNKTLVPVPHLTRGYEYFGYITLKAALNWSTYIEMLNILTVDAAK